MKKRVAILGAILIANSASAMLDGTTTTPALDSDHNKNNSKTNLLALANQKQSKRSCCAFLDCIFGHWGYLQPQTAFGIQSEKILAAPPKYYDRDED
jgi:hypothetical protein